MTFFKQIKTKKIEGENQLNLKNTMRILVDLARVYALKYRIFETNTLRKLKALEQKGVLSPKETQELNQTFAFFD